MYIPSFHLPYYQNLSQSTIWETEKCECVEDPTTLCWASLLAGATWTQIPWEMQLQAFSPLYSGHNSPVVDNVPKPVTSAFQRFPKRVIHEKRYSRLVLMHVSGRSHVTRQFKLSFTSPLRSIDACSYLNEGVVTSLTCIHCSGQGTNALELRNCYCLVLKVPVICFLCSNKYQWRDIKCR